MKTLSETSQILPLPGLNLLRVSEAVPPDRARIQSILELTGVFRSSEVSCALSLFDSYCNAGPNPDEYVFCCAYDEAQTALGFMCYGKASLTDHVYDLYWIATDPEYQGRGIGRLLIQHLDARLKALEARMVLAETSSRVEYEKTCHFYIRQDFQKVSVIGDYYALGDDLIVFAKRYH